MKGRSVVEGLFEAERIKGQGKERKMDSKRDFKLNSTNFTSFITIEKSDNVGVDSLPDKWQRLSLHKIFVVLFKLATAFAYHTALI